LFAADAGVAALVSADFKCTETLPDPRLVVLVGLALGVRTLALEEPWATAKC
jgi:hypothetical protein